MSYHIYTTKGIILSKADWKEADRVYNILTRDLGLIRATATGVRKEASKLRGALEPFQISLVSVVRGKDHWRITSAQALASIPSLPEVARPFSLFEKLVPGESVHPELFDTVEDFLDSRDPLDDMFETHLVAHMLYHLGYLTKDALELDKLSLIKAINQGLQASHLT